MIVHFMTHERSTLVNSEKYIGSKFIKHDLRSGDGSQREVADGVQLGNGKRSQSGILHRTSRNFFCHLRRRKLGCLAYDLLIASR